MLFFTSKNASANAPEGERGFFVYNKIGSGYP